MPAETPASPATGDVAAAVPLKPLFRGTEVAKLLGVTPRTLARWIDEKRWPPADVRRGEQVRNHKNLPSGTWFVRWSRPAVVAALEAMMTEGRA